MQEQFRQAAGALAQGQLDRAMELCAHLLQLYPDNVDVQHLYGVASLEAGAAEQGEALLSTAMSQRPQDPEIPYNFGSALLKLGRVDAALQLFDQAIAIAPEHVYAHTNRGTALLQLERHDAAAAAYQEALRLAPDHASAWFNLGNIEAGRGALEAAARAYTRAVNLQADYSQAQMALGQTLLDLGQGRQAIKPLRAATQASVVQPEAWRLLGQALAADNQFEAAVSAAQKATELAPDDANAWNSLGAALTSLGRLAPSEAALRKALELAPDHRLATGNLAALLELSNRRDECAALTAAALARWPEDIGLCLTRARLLKRRGEPGGAVTVLQALELDDALPQQQREVHFLLGSAYDAQGEADQAYAHFVSGNNIAAQQWQLGRPAPDALLPAAVKLAQDFSSGLTANWPETTADGMRQPAFILSFQRSGTTLLDTMLGAHPRTLVMEELPVLNQLITHIGNYPEALRSVSEPQLEQWREFYFARAGELAGAAIAPDTLLIDKSPLHTIHAGLLQRLFPGAPLIFALRHPADVVLSCFMQDFTMSSFMAHYTTLQGVTAVYGQIMKLWQLYRSLLPLNVMELRYETLVQAPEETLRSTLEFLKLPWDDAVLEYAAHARGRGLINTPSYHQVTEPVYQSSRNRWVRYRRHMAPVLAELAPWCRQFGYALN